MKRKPITPETEKGRRGGQGGREIKIKKAAGKEKHVVELCSIPVTKSVIQLPVRAPICIIHRVLITQLLNFFFESLPLQLNTCSR